MMTRRRKFSKQREEILKLLRSTPDHPGVRWLYDRLKPHIPGLALGTVYRNINLFIEEGEVMSVGVVNGEERFDGCARPHPHAVCLNCGQVTDITEPEVFRLLEGAVMNVDGFRLDSRRTVFYGFCAVCAS